MPSSEAGRAAQTPPIAQHAECRRGGGGSVEGGWDEGAPARSSRRGRRVACARGADRRGPSVGGFVQLLRTLSLCPAKGSRCATWPTCRGARAHRVGPPLDPGSAHALRHGLLLYNPCAPSSYHYTPLPIGARVHLAAVPRGDPLPRMHMHRAALRQDDRRRADGMAPRFASIEVSVRGRAVRAC